MQPAMVALLLGDLDSPGLKERTPVWGSRGGLREGSGVRRAGSQRERGSDGRMAVASRKHNCKYTKLDTS